MKVKMIYICMKKFDKVRANGYNNDQLMSAHTSLYLYIYILTNINTSKLTLTTHLITSIPAALGHLYDMLMTIHIHLHKIKNEM